MYLGVLSVFVYLSVFLCLVVLSLSLCLGVLSCLVRMLHSVYGCIYLCVWVSSLYLCVWLSCLVRMLHSGPWQNGSKPQLDFLPDTRYLLQIEMPLLQIPRSINFFRLSKYPKNVLHITYYPTKCLTDNPCTLQNVLQITQLPYKMFHEERRPLVATPKHSTLSPSSWQEFTLSPIFGASGLCAMGGTSIFPANYEVMQ